MKTQIGFSIIELMIVIAIIGILSMIAIPSYQNYIKRARFAEVIIATEPFKTAISLALQEGTTLEELMPGKDGIPNLPPKTKNFAGLKIDKGIITATASELINSATYIIKPNVDGSTWTVSGTCVKEGFCRT